MKTLVTIAKYVVVFFLFQAIAYLAFSFLLGLRGNILNTSATLTTIVISIIYWRKHGTKETRTH